ncbi:hypothetical protein Rsub_05285 [Raphidocelis subcapitata]|uniref:MYND-type domain-containing protein n=1 Tax=Raphidocelis subcapitata TaxID=307507 RepID=A0A2V0P2X2_9CHLO|nr:hypothetical protein Rsub_05285 [Raphidocelis subcapitata]|eukprot:GBF92203.1 hypothetical protein Rsub_05285 [Raphidocelis subcapitata]
MPPRAPAERAASKSESRHNQFWYPYRCEHPGCDKQEGLLKCGACNMAMYCGADHQRADWPAHKEECKVFKRLGLRSTFYRDEDMLAAYPLRPSRLDSNARVRRPSAEEAPQCPLCLKSNGEVAMTRTQCCGNALCDTSGEYVLMSYSRDFCERSHDRYTLCGYHGEERECDKSKDWRECPRCLSFGQLPDRLWRGLNAYNFCPLKSTDVPRHSRCDRCDGCQRLYMSGVEGSAFSGGRSLCPRCY